MLYPLKLAPATVPRAFLMWKAMLSAVAKILQTSVMWSSCGEDRAMSTGGSDLVV